MSNCICTKCKAEADSKCPACRTVFPDDQIESALSWILKRHIEKKDNDIYWLKIEYCIGKKDKSLEQALKQLYSIFKEMNEDDNDYPSFKQYACDHVWTMKKEYHSDIGCGHY